MAAISTQGHPPKVGSSCGLRGGALRQPLPVLLLLTPALRAAACALWSYPGWICAAHEAVDHLHGDVDVLKLHKRLVLDGAGIQPQAHHPPIRLAQLHDVCLCCVRRKVPYVQHLCLLNRRAGTAHIRLLRVYCCPCCWCWVRCEPTLLGGWFARKLSLFILILLAAFGKGG